MPSLEGVHIVTFCLTPELMPSASAKFNVSIIEDINSALQSGYLKSSACAPSATNLAPMLMAQDVAIVIKTAFLIVTTRL